MNISMLKRYQCSARQAKNLEWDKPEKMRKPILIFSYTYLYKALHLHTFKMVIRPRAET